MGLIIATIGGIVTECVFLQFVFVYRHWAEQVGGESPSFVTPSSWWERLFSSRAFMVGCVIASTVVAYSWQAITCILYPDAAGIVICANVVIAIWLFNTKPEHAE